MHGSLFVITLLYILFVDNGLKSAGIGGLILSLYFSLALLPIRNTITSGQSLYTTSSASVNVPTEQQGLNENTSIYKLIVMLMKSNVYYNAIILLPFEPAVREWQQCFIQEQYIYNIYIYL